MKRLLIIFAILLSLICLTIGGAWYAIRSERVQGWIVNYATERLSERLNAEVSIDHLYWDWPSELSVSGLYISDQQSDTLLFVPSLRAQWNILALRDSILAFPSITIDRPLIRLVQDSVGTNADFLRSLASPDAQPLPYAIDLQDIAIHQAQLHYIHLPSDRDVVVDGLTTEWSLKMDPKASGPVAKVHHVSVKASTSGVDGYVQTQIHGSLDSLYADELQLVYRDKSVFRGRVEVLHPANPDSLYAHVTCDDLSTNAITAYELVSDILRRPMTPPEVLRQLGQLHYQGQVTFHHRHVDLIGALRTAIGTIQTNMKVDMPIDTTLNSNLSTLNSNLSTLNYSLRVSSRSLRLSRFVNNVQLPALSVSALAEGTYDADHPLQFAYEASVRSQSPQLEGVIQAQGAVCDSLTMDMTMALPSLVTDRLLNQDSIRRLEVGTNLTAHWQAPMDSNFVKHGVGVVHIDTLTLQGHHHQFVMPYMDITASYDSLHLLTFESPVLNADIAGSMPWHAVPGALLRYAHEVLPSLAPVSTSVPSGQQLQLHAECTSLTELMRVFTSSRMVIPDTLVMDGYINDADSLYAFTAHLPVIHGGTFSYDSILVSITNATPDRAFAFHARTNQHIWQDSTRLQIDSLTYMVDMTALHDTLQLAFLLTPMDSLDLNPDVACVAAFARDEDDHLSMHAQVLPTQFDLGTKQWFMEESDLTYTAVDTTWLINHMRLYSSDQSIAVNGAISNNPNDTVKIELQDIQLGYFLSATAVLNAVDIQGSVSGWVHLFRKGDRTQFEADVSMPHGYINGADLGRVSATATLDSVTNHIMIEGVAQRDSIRVATVEGHVESNPTYWELNIDANGAPLSLINHWTKGIVEDIDGAGYGRIHVFGWKLHTFVTARVLAQDARIRVPFTGCTYSFTDTIVLDTTSIAFNHIRLHDKDGHTGVLDGVVTHDNFQDIRFDLNVQCRNLLGFDMPASEDQMYYGKAYASGKVHIYGGQEVNVDVDAMATDGTDFYLTTTAATSATNSDFIIFRSANQPVVTDTVATEVVAEPVSAPATPVHLRFNIDLTPQAKVHLLMNPHNGDGVVGRGEGSIALTMHTNTGDIQLLGSIALQSGEFTYSIANIVRRAFEIAEGSTVTWSGNPLNPELNITARYRCTASLKDLFGADASTITSRSSLPVDCVIKMQDNFDNPTFSFGIEFPQTEESVSAQIYAVINTESMLMRQVIYLLAFNRFFTPEYIRTATSGGGSGEAYSILSSTVTGQINSWLSKLTDVVSFGFNVRSDKLQANAAYEYEANIQLQPVDRLTINGNVGYRYNDLSNRPFFGDADIEYELTKNGKLRAKVYTHSVDKYSMKQANMQEGVGLIFRHDFNPGDAKRRRAIRQQIRERRQAAKTQSQQSQSSKSKK